MLQTAEIRSSSLRMVMLSVPAGLLAAVMVGLAVEPSGLKELVGREVDRPAVVRAFTGATLIPVSGPPVADGVMVVRDGRIESIGPRAAVVVPEGAEVVDCTGKVIIPGLICTHSHIGAPSGGDASAPMQPEARVLDAIDIRDPSVARARAGGVTTVNIMPGSGHLISGQTLYLKLRSGRTVEELAIRNDDGTLAGG